MSIIETIVRIFAPHCCIECNAETDKLLCKDCTDSLPVASSCCYRCLVPTQNYRVCAQCAPDVPLRQVVAYARYQGAAKEIVHRLKFERTQAAAAELAAMMVRRLPYLPAAAIIVHVPTATSRVRVRGYDQACLIAGEFARRTNGNHQSTLARVGQKRQVGLGRADRLRQAQGVFRPVRPDAVRGRHVVLVDDVITTGATLEAAAQTLMHAGAARVSAVVFARA